MSLGADKIEFHPCEQGTDEWHGRRLGIPTASEVKRILTPKQLKLSAQARGYMDKLLDEFYMGEPSELTYDLSDNYWIARGKELEPQARAAYEVMTGEETWQTGIIIRSGEWGACGASPDALVGDDGLCEYKCPSGGIHLGYLGRGIVPADYYLQMQVQLWVSQRKWNDFLSFHPNYPAFQIRTFPYPAIQEALDVVIPEFCTEMERVKQNLDGLGVKRAGKEFRFAGMSNEQVLEQIERDEAVDAATEESHDRPE